MLQRFPIVALTALCAVGRAHAQAPAAAELWRVAAISLSRPAALVGGPAGTFWNPAAGSNRRLAFGAQVVHTSDVVGLSGFLVAADHRVTRTLRVGAVAGRLEVRDLVRTTTSPNSVEGSIQVYEQTVGVGLVLGGPVVRLGALVRVHDGRFDRFSDQGVTADFGLVSQPLPRLTLAAATHFLPLALSEEATTDYYGGTEYVVLDRDDLAGAPTRIALRYGLSLRNTGDLEHDLGVGVTLHHQFFADLALTHESAFGQGAWRPGVGVALQVGRYRIAAARGSGLNDLGSTWRVGVDIEFAQ